MNLNVSITNPFLRSENAARSDVHLADVITFWRRLIHTDPSAGERIRYDGLSSSETGDLPTKPPMTLHPSPK